jgi:hypothetical protein
MFKLSIVGNLIKDNILLTLAYSFIVCPIKDVHNQSFIVFLELFNYASYVNLRLFIYFIFIDCIFITDNTCLLFWDVLIWEKGPRWLDHNYDMNCARNEDVDNLVWSCYRENFADFLVEKKITPNKNKHFKINIFPGPNIFDQLTHEWFVFNRFFFKILW